MERLYKNTTYTLMMLLSIAGGFIAKTSITKFDFFRSAKTGVALAIILILCSVPELLKLYFNKKQKKEID